MDTEKTRRRKPTKAQRQMAEFSERLYQLLRERPPAGCTGVGQLSTYDTALFDAILAAAKQELQA